MPRAVLFDLDDTLLINNMASFIPAYFQLLTQAFADRVPSERLFLELTRGIEAMDANEGSGGDPLPDDLLTGSGSLAELLPLL